ncbi:MAG: polysaccharide biosynthesis tyrosine autokinase [Actinomycetota bacterium]
MSEERSLVDILAIARKRWVWVAVPLILLVLLAVWYTGRQAPRYEATARVLLAEDASTRALDPGSQNPGILQRDIENQIALAYGSEVEALVTAELGELPELSVSHNPESDILLFEAEEATAEGAAKAANTWAEIFVQVRQEQDLANIAAAMQGLEERLTTLEEERDTIRAPLDSIRQQIRAATDPADAVRLQQNYDLLADDLRYELDLNNSEAQTTVADIAQLRLQAELAQAPQNYIPEPAEVPDGPANTPLSRILVIAVIAGAVLGTGLAVLVDARDTSIRSAADLQAVTDLPLLAAIPRAKRNERETIGLATVEDPNGRQADAYHQIRSALEFEMHEEPIRSIMVASPAGGDGRSTMTANLALALGSVGVRTALVDSDFRTGSLHRIFGVAREPGLSNLIRREIEASRVARSVPGDESEDVVVLPTGTVPPNPAAFVASRRFLGTLRWMGTQADMIVIDTPPLLGVPESHTLARQVDGVILLARAKRTSEQELRDALTVLDQVKARVVGVVLLGVPRQRSTVRQQVRARRQAARNLPPVLNVDEGLRTADLPTETAQAAETVAGGAATAAATDATQDHTAVADIEAGQAAAAAPEQTVADQTVPDPDATSDLTAVESMAVELAVIEQPQIDPSFVELDELEPAEGEIVDAADVEVEPFDDDPLDEDYFDEEPVQGGLFDVGDDNGDVEPSVPIFEAVPDAAPYDGEGGLNGGGAGLTNGDHLGPAEDGFVILPTDDPGDFDEVEMEQIDTIQIDLATIEAAQAAAIEFDLDDADPPDAGDGTIEEAEIADVVVEDAEIADAVVEDPEPEAVAEEAQATDADAEIDADTGTDADQVEAEIDAATDTDGDAEAVEVAQAGGDDVADADAHEPDEDPPVDAVDAAADEDMPVEMNGRGDESDEDWFQDRAPAATNGNGVAGNGHDVDFDETIVDLAELDDGRV